MREEDFGWSEREEELDGLGLEGGERKVGFWKKLIFDEKKGEGRLD